MSHYHDHTTHTHNHTHDHSVFQSLRGSQREKMLSVSRQVSSMRVGNLTFNHTALIYPAHQPPLIKGM